METSSNDKYTVRIECPDCEETVATECGTIDGDEFYAIPDGE